MIHVSITIKDAIKDEYGEARTSLDRLEASISYWDEKDELEDVPIRHGHVVYRKLRRTR